MFYLAMALAIVVAFPIAYAIQVWIIEPYIERKQLDAQLDGLTDHHFLDTAELVRDLENSHPDGKPLEVSAAAVRYLRKKRSWE